MAIKIRNYANYGAYMSPESHNCARTAKRLVLMPDVDVNTLDCVVIRGQGNAQASFITSIVLIIFFLCVAAYGLQVSFSSVGVGSVFTPLALTLMMILIMLKTVWGLIQRVPEKLEMAENVRIQVF
ncbi:MAG: hypothetical protein ACE5DZ_05270, partial [Mariprofundus sp.]